MSPRRHIEYEAKQYAKISKLIQQSQEEIKRLEQRITELSGSEALRLSVLRASLIKLHEAQNDTKDHLIRAHQQSTLYYYK